MELLPAVLVVAALVVVPVLEPEVLPELVLLSVALAAVVPLEAGVVPAIAGGAGGVRLLMRFCSFCASPPEP